MAVTSANPDVLDLGFARLDLQRARRQGFPEVVFGQGKTPEQIETIARRLHEHNGFALITRCAPEAAERLKTLNTPVHHDPVARLVRVGRFPKSSTRLRPAVLCAGTSDLPVAEEAAQTLEAFGYRPHRLYDVGVAGLHRLLSQQKILRSSAVLVVVAGMEGALPSVVAGLVDRPVIAVPTSVGYGANFQGLAALLGMLTSCGSGVTVVNIDNGFGGAFAAAQILRLASGAKSAKLA
jgi:NCAIR mutase (PurE)-related protein